MKKKCRSQLFQKKEESNKRGSFMAEHGMAMLMVLLLGVLATALMFAMQGCDLAIPVKVVQSDGASENVEPASVSLLSACPECGSDVLMVTQRLDEQTNELWCCSNVACYWRT